MRNFRRVAVLAVAGMLVLGSSGATAGNLLISQYNPYLAYGYGLSNWDNFSAALDAATGNQVTVTGRFENLTEMLGYDAIMLVARQPGGSDQLSATEEANIATYSAAGRSVLLVGENAGWSAWDNEILSIVGGSYATQVTGDAHAIVTNEITAGAATVYLPTAGTAGAAIGGTALYDLNFATLWGADQNVLTVLDVNVWSDNEWGTSDNAQFGLNVAEWLGAGSQPPVIPEPATLTLLGLSGLGLLARRRRVR